MPFPALRFVSWLAPSLPRELFRAVSRRVGRALGVPTTIRFETARSGPAPGELDPFTRGEADVGFLCAPTYVWLARRAPSPIELLSVAPVFADPRAAGRPVYYSDLVVRSADPARRFADLEGRRFAFNDTCSLSGFHALAAKLGPRERLLQTGSHLASIRAVLAGDADAAAIDSNALALRMRRDPTLAARLRVLESWGPWPIQPVVIRRALPVEVRSAIALALAETRGGEVGRFGLVGFARVRREDYDAEHACQRAASSSRSTRSSSAISAP